MQVEKLIKELPSVPADWFNGDVNSTEKNATSNGSIENGTSVRETQSMLLERIASEMNRLKFYIAHAQVFAHSYVFLAFFLFACRSKGYRIHKMH